MCMSGTKRKTFAIEFFSKIPYGYFVVPAFIVLFHTVAIFLLINMYSNSLDISSEYRHYFGEDNPLLIFFTRIILIFTLAIILKTAKENLDQIWNLENDVSFLFTNNEKGKRVFDHIKKDAFYRERKFLNYRLIYFAIPIHIVFSVIVGINSNIPWFFSYPVQIITWSSLWILIFYGTYSGVIGANIVLYLFDSESSALKIKNKKIKEIINGPEEVKFEDTKIEILNPDRLGGLESIKTLLKSPIIIGLSAIIMSVVTLKQMQEKPYFLFIDIFYYFIILMCAIIPPYIFSEFLSKKKKICLEYYYKKNMEIDYNRVQSMKNTPFDTKYVIQIIGLVISIGISLIMRFFIPPPTP